MLGTHKQKETVPGLKKCSAYWWGEGNKQIAAVQGSGRGSTELWEHRKALHQPEVTEAFPEEEMPRLEELARKNRSLRAGVVRV